MRSIWGIAVLGGAFVLLVLVVRPWSASDDTTERAQPAASGSRLERRPFDMRHADGAAGAPRPAEHALVPGPSHLPGAAPADHGLRFRRPPAPVADASDNGESAANDVSAPPARGTLEAKRRELPADVARRARSAEEAGDDAPEVRSDIVYDGGGEHLFDTTSRAEVSDAGRVSPTAGTVGFWINPQWQPDSQDDASFVQLGDGGLQITKNGDALRFEYGDGTGSENGGGTGIGEWQAGEWHYVTATWRGGTMALYVDGAQIFLNSAGTAPQFQSDKLYVGSAPSAAAVAPGELSHLIVLNRDASPDEVRQMYESGGAPPPQQ